MIRKYKLNGVELTLPRHARLNRQGTEIYLSVDYCADIPTNRLSTTVLVGRIGEEYIDQDTIDAILFEQVIDLRKNKRTLWKRPKQINPNFPDINVPPGISLRLKEEYNHGSLYVFYYPNGEDEPRDQYIYTFKIDSKREYVKALIAAKECIAMLRSKRIPFCGQTMYEAVDLNAPVTPKKTSRMQLGSITLPPGIYVDKNNGGSGLTYLKMVYKDYASTRTTHSESRRIFETSPVQIKQAIAELVEIQKQKHAAGYIVKGITSAA